MQTCLGVYLEQSLIKYAKITKDGNDTKVDAYGIKFYDNFSETIKNIIEETYSYNIPISINVSEEMYHYFDVFNLLTKKDMHSAIETEFESICLEKGYKANVYVSRYFLSKADQEKTKVVYISANKADVERKLKQFEGYKVRALTALPIAIANLHNISNVGSTAIINIEEDTNITIISEGKIIEVIHLKNGLQAILQNLNKKVNSYSKAYEICKNTTIYTQSDKDLIIEENEYMEDIMPLLYELVKEIGGIIDNYEIRMDNVLITGLVAVINNIDLYFGETLKNIKCTLLRPRFIQNAVDIQINIKDYIEVNSAIAIGLQGIGEGAEDVNFKEQKFTDKIGLGLDSFSKKEKKPQTGEKKSKFNFSFSLTGEFDRIEKNSLRTVISLLVLFITYAVLVVFLNSEIEKKCDEVNKIINNTNAQISLVEKDRAEISSRTLKYRQATQKLEDMLSETTNVAKGRNAIPNLLNQIVAYIPQEVKVTAIRDAGNGKIIVEAEAARYEELGYFKAILKTNYVLKNVTSNEGIKEGGVVKVKIEGELP